VPTVDQEFMIAVCSFCLRPNSDVKTLVAGPGVFICNDCIALCSQVVETKPASSPRVAPWEQEMALEDVLASLPRIAAAGAQVERNLVEWVRRARSSGATWARIGEALGMTRQSAWERFSGEE
jgi:ClpX C4-type zinc finger